MTEIVEDLVGIDLLERREVKVTQWMDFADYTYAVGECRTRFMATPVYPDHKEMIQGWIKGHDPAKVYGKRLSKVMNEEAAACAKALRKG